MSEPPSAFAYALANFSMNLYEKIGTGNVSTVFFSPVSISLALSMTFAGAAGNTKLQMKKMLFGELSGKGDEELHGLYGGIMEMLNKQGAPYKLNLANRVYADQSTLGQLIDQFVNILKTKYSSELQALDFGKGNEAATVINNWVSEKTNQKIKNIIPPDSLNSLTKLVLINAIYFKGDWLTKFDSAQTKKQQFYSGPNKEVSVEMMNIYNGEFYYGEDDTYQVLGMPYTGKDLIMFVWLPKERHGLGELEKKLNGKALLDSVDQVLTNVTLKHVAIPKFKLEETIGLEDMLQALGATDMFVGEKADFSNINGQRNLAVSKVIHKAFVEVNEEGTEAAAATAVVMCRYMAMPMEEASFIADHPFMFAIVDMPSNSILFLGRFNSK